MSGAAAANNRRNEEFSEYGAGAAIAMANPLMKEALELAYTKLGQADVKRNFGSMHPKSITFGQNGDGTPGVSIQCDSGVLGILTKLNIDTNRDGRADGTAKISRTFGAITRFDVDYNNDGRIDAVVKPEYRLLSLTGLAVDTNGDGKPEMRLKPDVEWNGLAKGMKVDLGCDGKDEGYIEFKRNLFGNIDGLRIRPKN